MANDPTQTTRELQRTLAAWTASLAGIGGCGDGGCVVHRPGGMHTNGGCRCSEDRQTARRVMRLSSYYKAQIERLVQELGAP